MHQTNKAAFAGTIVSLPILSDHFLSAAWHFTLIPGKISELTLNGRYGENSPRITFRVCMYCDD
jgi:hypothetical protein